MVRPTMLRFKLFYFFIYVSFTTHHFLNLYFREIGFSGVEIGVIKAVSSIVMVFSQPIWGMFCDILKMRKGLLNLLLFASGLTFMLVPINQTISWVICIILTYSFFKNPIIPVADSIVMITVKGNGSKYSQVRLWGAVGLTASVVFMGYYFKEDNLSDLFWVYLIFTYLALIVTAFLPRENISFQGKQLRLKDFLCLTAYPGFNKFLIATLFLQTGAFIIDGFFGLYVKERIGNEVTLGWALTVAGLSEVLIYHYLGKIRSAFSARNLLIISSVLSAVRWFLFGQSTMVIQIFLLQLLHGVTFGFFYISAVTYVNHLLPQEFSTSGQTLLWANAFGLSAVLGSILGGYIYDLWNYQMLFNVAGILTMISTLIFITFPKEGKK